MAFGSGSPLKLALAMVLLTVGIGTQLSRNVASHGNATALANRQAPPADPYARRRLSSGGRVTIEADRYGQFNVDVEIEGRVVPMMVDTGASAVSLSAEDAASMGIRPVPYEYTLRMRTANGIASAARVRLHEVRVGGIVARDVMAVVAPPGQATPNLLGMTFLKTLRRFAILDQQLVLEQ